MKKFALTILVLLLLVGGGTAYYFLKVKTYDLSQDSVLEEITEDEYEIVLPPEEDVPSGTAANATSGEESSASENPNGNVPAQTAPDKSQSAATNTKATPETIKAKFRPSFENLEAQANGKINSLVGRAISEYKEKKASGEEISYSYFLTKYNTAGEALEAKTDQAFNTLYSALQQDLKDHGFDPSEAEDVRASYEAAKKHRRNAILSAAMEKL